MGGAPEPLTGMRHAGFAQKVPGMWVDRFKACEVNWIVLLHREPDQMILGRKVTLKLQYSRNEPVLRRASSGILANEQKI